ncbi:hypothetical protein V9T40_001640 [Parthenolecanium corni]|uniref:Pentraxin (PTX) domain-containing protein n=1 Tax=Parthenolecanium corni TaxID=536013 RepID=A0AAN9TL30_9HEMI
MRPAKEDIGHSKRNTRPSIFLIPVSCDIRPFGAPRDFSAELPDSSSVGLRGVPRCSGVATSELCGRRRTSPSWSSKMRRKVIYATLLVGVVWWGLRGDCVVSAGQTGWRPLKSKPDLIIGPRVVHSSPKKLLLPPSSTFLHSCSLYKAVMDQHSFHQYIQYKHHIPDMKEFTLCTWHKLYNHSVNHPIFSYALPRKPRTISSWIENTPKKSYYMLAVNGHTLYRINYPIKLYKWYHSCQSWNGKTGEWQLWINGERVSRGYYNLMVGKPIKSGGIAISGQELTEVDLTSNEWREKGSGLQGELTLIQLYKAALSKGKAYSDHKHHHAHEWGHDGEMMNNDDDANGSTPPNLPPPPSSSEHPFLENGQLKHRLPVHELLAKGVPQPMPSNLQLLGGFEGLNANGLPSLEGTVAPLPLPSPISGLFGPNFGIIKRRSDEVGVERSKRHTNESLEVSPVSDDLSHRMMRARRYNTKWSTNADKRALIINGDGLPSPLQYSDAVPTLFSELDGHDIAIDDPSSFFKNTVPDSGQTKIEYEPAEWEVKKIGEVCDGCEPDPFKKANVLSWRDTPKKLLAGAEYVPAIPKCYIF